MIGLASLAGGTSMAALLLSAATQERPVTPPAAAVPAPSPGGQAADAPPAPPQRVFRDAQGNPLPPDIQRQIEAQLRDAPAGTGMVRAVPDPDAIVVTGDRPRGSVIGDVPAERSFDTLDVRAYGVTDIAELIDTIAPQVRSNRGREDAGPITLLNGRRVSNFKEIARIPTEAIERMDVFPEELALRYGYRADQKVVNIVTFLNFRSAVAQASGSAPTRGGSASAGATGDGLVIRGDTRLGIGASVSRTSGLTEAERDLVQPDGDAAVGGVRTLVPRAERYALNAVVGAPLSDAVSATLTGQFEASDLAALLGPGLDDAIVRDTATRRGRAGAVVDGRVGRWQWSLTGGYDRVATDVRTDFGGGGPRDRARSVSALAEADLVASGPVFSLPAGPLTASVGGGVSSRDFTGRSLTSAAPLPPTRLSREAAAARASVDLPIVRGDDGGGRLSANANLEVERLSDFGTLRDVGAGLTWAPARAIGLVGSVTWEEGSPTVEQLGAPTIVTPAARVFDLTRGEAVDVVRAIGGNPGLVADDRRVVRLGLNLSPWADRDLTFSLDYVDTSVDDPIATFPLATPALEAAFPDRFVRDAGGRLVAIDGRPLNFARSTVRQLRTGVDFARPLGDPRLGLPPGSQIQTRVFASEAEARRRYPNAVFARAEPGSDAARRGETLRSRVYVSLYHNWTLTDRVTLTDGSAALDRLDGFATDARGGRPRHEIEFQLGAFKSGLGGRLGVDWQSGTRIDGPGGTDGLRFGSIGRVNLSLFANPADRLGGTEAPDWVKRTRVTLAVTNLFDARPDVRAAGGGTPIAFQPGLLDPLGRTVTLTLRKTF